MSFSIFHNTGLSELLVILLLELDGEAQDHLYDIHKREIMAHSTGHFIYKLALPDPLRLADCHLVFPNNDTQEDVELNPNYVALSMQLLHRL